MTDSLYIVRRRDLSGVYLRLERQAKAGDFETFNARLAWMAVKP